MRRHPRVAAVMRAAVAAVAACQDSETPDAPTPHPHREHCIARGRLRSKHAHQTHRPRTILPEPNPGCKHCHGTEHDEVGGGVRHPKCSVPPMVFPWVRAKRSHLCHKWGSRSSSDHSMKRLNGQKVRLRIPCGSTPVAVRTPPRDGPGIGIGVTTLRLPFPLRDRSRCCPSPSKNMADCPALGPES